MENFNQNKVCRSYAIINTCIAGSTGKIAVGLHQYITDLGYDSIFCYGREDGEVKENFYKIGSKLALFLHVLIARILGLQGYGSYFVTKRLIKKLTRRKVETLFLVSPHGYYLNERLLYSFVAKNNLNLIYIMIDEYAFLGKCGYSTFCNNYLSGCHNCPKIRVYPKSLFINGSPVIYKMKERAYKNIKSMVFVGPEYTVDRAKKSPLLRGKTIKVLDEAINTSFYLPRDNSDLINELGISSEKIVIICIAPYSLKRKGCHYFVELAKIFENDERYIFVHVGFDVSKELVKLPSNYLAIGFLKNQKKLAQFYSLGDLFVFPSVSDTMPNACLEALSCGTPLLCFDISGMPYIADESVATFVKARDVEKMAEIIQKTQKKTNEQIKKCRAYAIKRYDNQKYYRKLYEIAEVLSREE